MKAWRLDGLKRPLREVELPIPTPMEGQVLVKVKADGLCHSDVGYMDGTLRLPVPLPIILGHEAVGTIADIGPGVIEWKLGDTVAGAISASDCPGVTHDGAYAEYVIMNATKLVPLPDGMDWSQAAASTDAGLTSYTGVVVYGEVNAGDRVGIVGLGGLGMIGARIAVARGATVYGVEPREMVWAEGRSLGLADIFSDVSELRGLDLDVVVDFAGYGSTAMGAVRAVKTGGRVVCVGVGESEWTFDAVDLVSRSIEVRGAVTSGNPDHLLEVLRMFDTGDLVIRAEDITFHDIPEGLERLRRGEVNGRLVAIFD
jgi:propanol-preferring alcohol dehydrogenase